MRELWNPSANTIERSHVYAYRTYVESTFDMEIHSYEDLWAWSVDQSDTFWKSLFDYFNLPFKGELDVCYTGSMPNVHWFPGIKLNYAQRIWQLAEDNEVAIVYKNEQSNIKTLTWAEVRQQVRNVQAYLLACGVGPGDRVAAFLPNVPEASIAFLATIGLGAIWSSCSPDFGVESVVDRFDQIQPKVFIGVDGYFYGGKTYNKESVVLEIFDRLKQTDHLLVVSFIQKEPNFGTAAWNLLPTSAEEMIVRDVPFNHPIWILFSSGTTGAPKAITHSHGGVLLEHVKYLAFHNDVHKGERFFWYSTTGWMMWNFVHASWLMGAAVVLYDGSPVFPETDAMWQFVQEGQINHLGTSAPFIIACMKKELSPGEKFDLTSLRSIGSTGSPLPPEGFEYIYHHVKNDIWLCSISGGTDLCTAFVGGCPTLPVFVGEIQCRTLGCALYSWDDQKNHENNRVGEMVITQPMPSMPIYFWNDEKFERYRASYFEMFPNVWRHGDWVEITDRNTLIIYGRSDATLNRQGIRIGTSEIYRALHDVIELKDSLIVNIELSGGRHYMPLFIVLNDGHRLDDELKNKIKNNLRSTYTPRHVPDEIVAVPDIPYTISGKKMEAPVKKVLMGLSTSASLNIGAMRNPDSIKFFESFANTIK